jgi:hypothetical protein
MENKMGAIGERIAEISEYKGTLQPNNNSYVSLVNLLALGVVDSILQNVLEVIVEEKK